MEQVRGATDMASAASVDIQGVSAIATDVVIAIVNYKTPELVIDCLASLASELLIKDATFRVVVADNASGDGSVDKISSAIEARDWGGWVCMLALARNGGFGFGNNAVFKHVLAGSKLPRYIWLLNSDTIVHPQACRELVKYLDDNPRVGIAGSRLEDLDGPVQISAFRFHSIAGEFEAAARTGVFTRLLRPWVVAPPAQPKAAPCDWVSGASMMIRLNVLETVGPFDEDYFLYFEETDLCLRAARAGFKCHSVPSSRVIHLVGASTGITVLKEKPKRRAAYWFQSRHRYYVKNYGAVYSVLADLAVVSGTLVWYARCAFQRRPTEVPAFFIKDILLHAYPFKR